MIVRLLSFYSAYPNDMGVYIQFDYSLSLTRELEAVGENSRIKALRELDELREYGVELENDEPARQIEEQIPGNTAFVQ